MLLPTACFTVPVLLATLTTSSPLTQHAAPIHNLTIEPAHCTDHPYWTGTGLNPADCDTALHAFYYASVSIHRHERFEFLAPAAPPRTPLYGFHLPIRFRVATCVLVVASLSVFPVGSLPGGGERIFPRSDVASYWDLMHGARSVRVRCVLGGGWRGGRGREGGCVGGVFVGDWEFGG
ncbi:hypothetical protein G7Y79_00023g053640 [Physcia stellaris]|nr:hypothetical protein G7Y79_00023g053640 [Physcia stellaris]